jgi:glutathione S-transferase
MSGTFTLYGNEGSSASQRVTLTLAEGGFTDYEYVGLAFPKGEHKVSPVLILGTTARIIRIPGINGTKSNPPT